MNKPTLFLSYNNVDRSSVVAVKKLLEARGITTFLDLDQLGPGLPWPVAIEEGLRSVGAVAVFIGRELGGWQKREMSFALDRQVREEKRGHPFPVIPVLLGGADLTPSFLFQNTWIDLRSGLDSVAVAETLDTFERAVTGAEPVRKVDPERTAALCPYRGLEPFREEHAAFFAGRAAFTRHLFDFTLKKDLVVVVGPSGSGKSSVVHSGLVPLLRRELPPATTWDVVTFTPGSDPFLRLASAVIPLLEQDLTETDRLTEAQKLGERLTSGKVHLESVIDRAIEKSNGTGRLLIIADQFEELFTLTAEVNQRPFAWALLRALGKARFTLLVILRADFYGQIITLDRALSDLLAPAQVNIGALTSDELRESIVCPAKLVGLDFGAGLVDRLLQDAGSEPGNLPLLEFALTTLWSRREGRTLTYAAYNEIGGVTGALAQRAEAEFSRFLPEEQTAVRRLFSRLSRVAKPGEGAIDVRRRIELQATDPTVQKVARALAKPNVRLLVMGSSEGEGPAAGQTVEVAHEALIRRWERLRGWINEDIEFILWRQRIETLVEQWEQHERDAGCLLRGSPLSEAERWLGARPEDLTTATNQFIQESIALRRKESEQQNLLERTEQEFQLASNIQQALFPKDFPKCPFISVSAVNYQCGSVGGDYYDVLPLNEKRIAFVLADVSGKGLGAAMLTPFLQGALIGLTWGTDPAHLFGHVNRFLCDHVYGQRYATMFFAILEDSGKLEYINAGLQSPILVRKGVAEEAFIHGTFPVGLVPEAEFTTRTVQLQPNDTLVIFSDGVTEALDAQEELYGVSRLQGVLQGKADLPLNEIQQAVIDSVTSFSCGRQYDDLTLLLVRYRGVGSRAVRH